MAAVPFSMSLPRPSVAPSHQQGRGQSYIIDDIFAATQNLQRPVVVQAPPPPPAFAPAAPAAPLETSHTSGVLLGGGARRGPVARSPYVGHGAPPPPIPAPAPALTPPPPRASQKARSKRTLAGKLVSTSYADEFQRGVRLRGDLPGGESDDGMETSSLERNFGDKDASSDEDESDVDAILRERDDRHLPRVLGSVAVVSEDSDFINVESMGGSSSSSSSSSSDSDARSSNNASEAEEEEDESIEVEEEEQGELKRMHAKQAKEKKKKHRAVAVAPPPPSKPEGPVKRKVDAAFVPDDFVSPADILPRLGPSFMVVERRDPHILGSPFVVHQTREEAYQVFRDQIMVLNEYAPVLLSVTLRPNDWCSHLLNAEPLNGKGGRKAPSVLRDNGKVDAYLRLMDVPRVGTEFAEEEEEEAEPEASLDLGIDDAFMAYV
jgi:hypothetical protein